MTTPNPVKEYLNKLGIKQKYHEPVLQKQKRFYIIQIQNFEVISKDFKQTYNPQSDQTINSKQEKTKTTEKNTAKSTIDEKIQEWQGKVTFEIGCRESFTEMFLNNEKLLKSQKIAANIVRNQSKVLNLYKKSNPDRINAGIKQLNENKSDMHIFPFQKQEVMTIKFQVVQNLKVNNSKEYLKEYGYALIPLVPFIKMPYTQHQVDVDLVYQNERKEIKKDLIANLTMSLYFMHNFKARLFIEVVRADLERNLALIGQMYPLIRMYLRDLQYQTDVIEEGGIKPHWKSQKEDEFCYFNIPLESVQDDLFIFLFYNREVTIDEIVGKLKINLQEETMFKRGINLEKFISQTIDTVEKIMKEREEQNNAIWNQQTGKNKKDKQKLGANGQEKVKKSQKNKKEEMTKEQQFEFEMKKMFDRLKSRRKQIYYKALSTLRAQLISDLICKSHTLNPNKPPEFINKYSDQIFKKFNQSYGQIEEALIGQFLKLLADQTENEKNFFNFKIGEQKSTIDPKREIQDILIEELKEVGKIINAQMINREIALNYINPFPKNELDTEREVGKLEFRSFFVYEFDHIIKESESYVEDDF